MLKCLHSKVARSVSINANPSAPVSINALIAIESPFWATLIGTVKVWSPLPNNLCKFSSFGSISIPPKVETFLRPGLFPSLLRPYCLSRNSALRPSVPQPSFCVGSHGIGVLVLYN